MTCAQALELISARLDGELSPEEDAALQAHLELCPDCKRLADSLRGMDALLSSLEEPAPKSLKQGVLYRIDQASGKAKKPRRWFGPGTAIGAVAAALVLLVGLGIIPLNARKNSSVDFAAPVQTDEAWMESPQSEGLSGGALEVPSSSSVMHYSPSPDGIQILPNATMGDSCESNDYACPETEAEAPGAPLETIEHRGINMGENEPAPADETLWSACAALSAEEDAAVLLYTDFDAKSLFALLEAEQPELFALVEQLEPEELDGMPVFKTDCGTALAIQEWLLARLPREEALDAASEKAESSLRERMEALDPGSESLYRIISWDRLQRNVAWPAEWPDGWAERLRSQKNWGLFFPDEDFTPNAEKTAYLVFAD